MAKETKAQELARLKAEYEARQPRIGAPTFKGMTPEEARTIKEGWQRGGQGDADTHLSNAAMTAIAATAAATSPIAAAVSTVPIVSQAAHEYNNGGADGLLSSPVAPQVAAMALPALRYAARAMTNKTSVNAYYEGLRRLAETKGVIPEGYPLPDLDLANQMLGGRTWSSLPRAERLAIRQKTGLQQRKGGGGVWEYEFPEDPPLSEEFMSRFGRLMLNGEYETAAFPDALAPVLEAYAALKRAGDAVRGHVPGTPIHSSYLNPSPGLYATRRMFGPKLADMIKSGDLGVLDRAMAADRGLVPKLLDMEAKGLPSYLPERFYSDMVPALESGLSKIDALHADLRQAISKAHASYVRDPAAMDAFFDQVRSRAPSEEWDTTLGKALDLSRTPWLKYVYPDVEGTPVLIGEDGGTPGSYGYAQDKWFPAVAVTRQGVASGDPRGVLLHEGGHALRQSFGRMPPGGNQATGTAFGRLTQHAADLVSHPIDYLNGLLNREVRNYVAGQDRVRRLMADDYDRYASLGGEVGSRIQEARANMPTADRLQTLLDDAIPADLAPWDARTYGEVLRSARSGTHVLNQDAKGGATRSDAKGGDVGQSEDISPDPGGASVSSPAGGGPRIVINPTTFRNKKDALCVAFNEGFRLWMEANDFQPQSEPTDTQRKFFSDTAYADDELQLRRTILARIATFDTSVKDPTDDQLAETAGFLGAILESDWCKNEWERDCVSRLAQAAQAAVGAEPVEARQEPLEAREAEPLQARAAMGGGETDDKEKDKPGQAVPAQETDSGMDGVMQQEQDVNGDGTVIDHSADYEAQLDLERQEDMAETNAEYEKLRQSGALDDLASFDNSGQTAGQGQPQEPGVSARPGGESGESGRAATPAGPAETGPDVSTQGTPRRGGIENGVVSKDSPGSLSYRGPRRGGIENPIVDPTSQGSIEFSGVMDGGIESPIVDPNSPGSLSYRRRRRRKR